MRIAYLGELVMELEVKGRRPVGRPKKTWSKVEEEAKHHRRYDRG